MPKQMRTSVNITARPLITYFIYRLSLYHLLIKSMQKDVKLLLKNLDIAQNIIFLNKVI